jgi:putative SOS response-associated peptidase YedK
MKWGLIPNWARDASIANGTMNAKSETAAEKHFTIRLSIGVA